MGKLDKMKEITIKYREKLKRMAVDKFGMSDEGIERAKNIGKVTGMVAIAFTVGRVTSNRNTNGYNEYAGKETITAIGGQATSNTNATKIGKGAIVTKDGGVVIKKIVVNGALNVDMK